MERKKLINDFLSIGNATYVFDTSAIIDIGGKYPQQLSRFFRKNRDSVIITPEVMIESLHANKRWRNKRTKVLSDIVFDSVAAGYLHSHVNKPGRTDSIRESENYDLHRWLAVKMTYAVCDDKKTKFDEISVADSHIVATSLTLAEEGAKYDLGNELIVVASTDDHITESITGLKNSIYGPMNPAAYANELITPRPEIIAELIPRYANVRVPNLKKILGCHNGN